MQEKAQAGEDERPCQQQAKNCDVGFCSLLPALFLQHVCHEEYYSQQREAGDASEEHRDDRALDVRSGEDEDAGKHNKQRPDDFLLGDADLLLSFLYAVGVNIDPLPIPFHHRAKLDVRREALLHNVLVRKV